MLPFSTYFYFGFNKQYADKTNQMAGYQRVFHVVSGKRKFSAPIEKSWDFL